MLTFTILYILKSVKNFTKLQNKIKTAEIMFKRDGKGGFLCPQSFVSPLQLNILHGNVAKLYTIMYFNSLLLNSFIVLSYSD
jgi:hypothetical protein